MRKIRAVSLVALIALSLVSGASVDAAEVPNERPTVAELMARLTMTSSNSISPSMKERLDTALAELPRVIAEIEAAYPNLTYVFMGRDTVFLADLIDAFYTSINQPGRVVRLDVSTDSFNKATPEQLIALLGTNGFRPRNDRGLERPYVFIDRTTLGPQSQSTILFNTAIRWLLSSGISLEKALRQIGVINVGSKSGPAGGPNQQTVPVDSPQNVYIETSRDSRLDGLRLRPGSVRTISATNLIDLEELDWHGPFGELRVTPDGRIAGEVHTDSRAEALSRAKLADQPFSAQKPVTAEGLRASRARALTALSLALPAVQSEEFRVKVARQAVAHGRAGAFERRNATRIATVQEALRRASETSVESRDALLEFLDRARLHPSSRYQILNAIQWKSADAQRRARLILDADPNALSIRTVELILALETLTEAVPQDFERLGSDGRDRLERRTLDLIERLALVGGFKSPETAQSVLTTVGAFLQDLGSLRDEAVIAKLEQRWNEEIPRLGERAFLESDVTIQTVPELTYLQRLSQNPELHSVADTTKRFALFGFILAGMGAVSTGTVDLVNFATAGFGMGGAMGGLHAAIFALRGGFQPPPPQPQAPKRRLTDDARLRDSSTSNEPVSTVWSEKERRVLSCPQSLVRRSK